MDATGKELRFPGHLFTAQTNSRYAPPALRGRATSRGHGHSQARSCQSGKRCFPQPALHRDYGMAWESNPPQPVLHCLPLILKTRAPTGTHAIPSVPSIIAALPSLVYAVSRCFPQVGCCVQPPRRGEEYIHAPGLALTCCACAKCRIQVCPRWQTDCLPVFLRFPILCRSAWSLTDSLCLQPRSKWDKPKSGGNSSSVRDRTSGPSGTGGTSIL